MLFTTAVSMFIFILNRTKYFYLIRKRITNIFCIGTSEIRDYLGKIFPSRGCHFTFLPVLRHNVCMHVVHLTILIYVHRYSVGSGWGSGDSKPLWISMTLDNIHYTHN